MKTDTIVWPAQMVPPADLAAKGYVSTTQLSMMLGIAISTIELYRHRPTWPTDATIRRGIKVYFHKPTVYEFFRNLPMPKHLPVVPAWLDEVGHPMAATLAAREVSPRNVALRLKRA